MTWQSPNVTILVLQYLKQMPKQPQTPQCPLFSLLGTVYIYSAPLSYYLSSFISVFLSILGNLHCRQDKGPTLLNFTSHLVQAWVRPLWSRTLVFPKNCINNRVSGTVVCWGTVLFISETGKTSSPFLTPLSVWAPCYWGCNKQDHTPKSDELSVSSPITQPLSNHWGVCTTP